MNKEIIVDSFAGGGGASLGITRALGREPDIAINHDAAAIAMHAANHPATKHFTEDVWKVAPHEVTFGKTVGLLWASPDCKHFSRAKGSKPVEKKIRSLAWVVCKWAAEVKPRLIMLENVREFEDWGPLIPQWSCRECTWKGTEGQAKLARRRRACPRCDSYALKLTEAMIPDPDRKGLTFRRFVGRLKAAGYAVERRVLNAADYGAPTHRRRLFLIARRDGLPIVWPTPSHGDPNKIHLDLLVRDLKPWRTAAECIDWNLPCQSIFDRKKPLADATMRRIALGVKRYVIENPHPFIVGVGGPEYAGTPRSANRPLGTVLPKNSSAIVTPYLASINHSGERFRGQPVDQPLGTVTSQRGEAVIMPFLARTAYKKANGSYVNSPEEPMRTITAQQDGASVVAAFLAKHYGGAVGVGVNTPMPTTTERGTQNQLVAANLIHFNHGDKQWSAANEPMRTITTNNHARLVYSFLTKFYGVGVGQSVNDPLGAVTSKDHFGLVMVTVNGEPYVIVDIGMRMFTPRELARCQGFPDSYVLTGSKTSQVARIGNSVSPVMSEALVRANFIDIRQRMAA